MTPMMEQYLQIKEQYRDHFLFYRLGDFYEMFFDDAVLASRELDLTLTGRDCGEPERAPMCGVPFHSSEGYIGKLIEKGYSNVICAQPFGCLPNHVVGKGTVRILREMYPNANIFPIDYDAGASKVNQENRIKLMLALAKDGQTSESEVPQ